jgi:hypothetical protein
VPSWRTLDGSDGGSVKRQPKVVVINSVPLRNAVLCADCECISESRSEVCGVCGGRSLVNLGRLLGSALQSEAEFDLTDPVISRELQTLVDSALLPHPHWGWRPTRPLEAGWNCGGRSSCEISPLMARRVSYGQ